MNTESTTDKPEASSAMPCSACGRLFQPYFLTGIQRWSKVCGNCAVLNLAKFMEDTEPGDSLAEISKGEQAGAMLREIATPNTRKHGGLHCYVCDNLNPRCPNCGGPGTPWLI